ncbi:MAG: sodium:alanine symporter family protein [Chlamydiales bacterium]|nr:sodium:alanine symporter family protein [Chlamydiales bacterium]
MIAEWLWGAPLLFLLIATGVFLTVRLRGVQFRYFGYAHKLAFTRHDDHSKGDISHFQALMTALSGSIGIGSITGVATAISLGGLGALVWMWGAALFGMATKYTECVLAIKYRTQDANKEMCGGPMFYLEKALKSRYLAIAFAFLAMITAIGTGNMVQSNSVADALNSIAGWHPLFSGVCISIITGLALFGGIKSIGRIASILVPIMGAFYISCGIIILILFWDRIPSAFGLIFESAFSGQAAIGGFAGSTIMMAIQMGVARGVFSSEAGLGVSSIAAAAAKTKTPSHQALIAMIGVFITTGIVCTITGLTIALTGVLGSTGGGSQLALAAFSAAIPKGALIVTIALIPFAYSTILGWAYYGEKCTEYLFGLRAVKPYRLIYTLLIIPGAVLGLDVVWGIADICNGLMAIPNLIGLICLSGIAAKELKSFQK